MDCQHNIQKSLRKTMFIATNIFNMWFSNTMWCIATMYQIVLEAVTFFWHRQISTKIVKVGQFCLQNWNWGIKQLLQERLHATGFRWFSSDTFQHIQRHKWRVIQFHFYFDQVTFLGVLHPHDMHPVFGASFISLTSVTDTFGANSFEVEYILPGHMCNIVRFASLFSFCSYERSITRQIYDPPFDSSFVA